MTQTDNSALPKAVEMQYLPGQGLQSYQLMTKIWSNDVTKDCGNERTNENSILE